MSICPRDSPQPSLPDEFPSSLPSHSADFPKSENPGLFQEAHAGPTCFLNHWSPSQPWVNGFASGDLILPSPSFPPIFLYLFFSCGVYMFSCVGITLHVSSWDLLPCVTNKAGKAMTVCITNGTSPSSQGQNSEHSGAADFSTPSEPHVRGHPAASLQAETHKEG